VGFRVDITVGDFEKEVNSVIVPSNHDGFFEPWAEDSADKLGFGT
jgi:hypothetical protein